MIACPITFRTIHSKVRIVFRVNLPYMNLNNKQYINQIKCFNVRRANQSVTFLQHINNNFVAINRLMYGSQTLASSSEINCSFFEASKLCELYYLTLLHIILHHDLHRLTWIHNKSV